MDNLHKNTLKNNRKKKIIINGLEPDRLGISFGLKNKLCSNHNNPKNMK